MPLLLFGLSNLFLASSLGRSLVAEKISLILKIETSVQGSSWSPWNGITCYGIVVKQPIPLRNAIGQPLLKIQELRISPDWIALSKRKLVIRAISLIQPELNLPIEIFSEPTHSIPAEKIQTLTDLPTATLPPPSLPGPMEPPLTFTPPPSSYEPIPDASTTVPIPPAALATLPDPAISPPQKKHSSHTPKPSQPTFWVDISKAHLRVICTGSEIPLYEIEQIDARLPLGGGSAKSEIRLKHIHALGSPLADALTIPIQLRDNIIETKKFLTEYSGISCAFQAQLTLNQLLPFQINCVIPQQSQREWNVSKDLQVHSGEITAQARLQGLLTLPNSWQGQAISRAKSIEIQHTDDTFLFNHAHAIFLLNRGKLQCIDTRLIGDSLSLLANGTVLQDGRFAANTRFISTPERLHSISKYTHPEGSDPNFTPLSTPQRVALDLRFFGNRNHFQYQPDPSHPLVPFE